MQTVTSISEIHSITSSARRDGLKIAVVPTMGYLHEGHTSLMQIARQHCDLLIVTIFVNPTQFAAGEDLDRYPRDLEMDEASCRKADVDVIFCPDCKDMYPDHPLVTVNESTISKGLCGASRPGHFTGVLSVVAKLFNIIEPDVAIFGRKDAQQARLIEQMVQDLNFRVKVIIGPIVREADGLAMSSRNVYLDDEERARALCLYSAIMRAETLYQSGERSASAIKKQMSDILESSRAIVEYIEIIDYGTFGPVEEISNENVLVAIAVKIGQTRLIDNTLLRG